MLISITEKCRMGCTHCMDDAKPDCDKFMSEETFKKALAFNLKYDKTVTITGGEPTEHPMFWELMDIIADTLQYNQIASVLTNGMNLSDDDIPKIIQLREKCKGNILYQVSSIKPYYPIYIDLDQKIFRMPDFCIARKLEKLESRGRAAQHKNWIFNAKAPQCFNIRSTVRLLQSLNRAIAMLRAGGKFCTPQIAYDGSLKVGESTLCPAVAHIDDTEKEIVQKISSYTCNCKDCQEMLQKLPLQYRQAIGEC